MSAKKTAHPTPEMSDFQSADETLIEYTDTKADAFGRRTFFAYWITDNVGPRLNEHGVRGQVFHTDPIQFARRHDGPVREI